MFRVRDKQLRKNETQWQMGMSSPTELEIVKDRIGWDKVILMMDNQS